MSRKVKSASQRTITKTEAKRVRADVEDGERVTVVVLVLSTDPDFLPPGARPPSGPIVTGKQLVRAIVVGGYAVAPMTLLAEPKILGMLEAKDEGYVWCRGWEGDVVNAMRTVNAVKDLEA